MFRRPRTAKLNYYFVIFIDETSPRILNHHKEYDSWLRFDRAYDLLPWQEEVAWLLTVHEICWYHLAEGISLKAPTL